MKTKKTKTVYELDNRSKDSITFYQEDGTVIMTLPLILGGSSHFDRCQIPKNPNVDIDRWHHYSLCGSSIAMKQSDDIMYEIDLDTGILGNPLELKGIFEINQLKEKEIRIEDTEEILYEILQDVTDPHGFVAKGTCKTNFQWLARFSLLTHLSFDEKTDWFKRVDEPNPLNFDEQLAKNWIRQVVDNSNQLQILEKEVKELGIGLNLSFGNLSDRIDSLNPKKKNKRGTYI